LTNVLIIHLTAYKRPQQKNHYKTKRSSALAERLRDASCLSVVSISVTIPQAQCTLATDLPMRILPMRIIKFCSVVFGVTSRLSAINKIHWCVIRLPLSTKAAVL